VQCDPGYVCEPRESADQTTLVGVCSSCDCRGCGDGQSCVDHACVDAACENQTCDAGTRCVDGDCVDNCDGASCPAGQLCQGGACIADPSGAGGAGNDGGAGGERGGGIVIENPNGNGNGGEAGDGDPNGVPKDHVVVEVVGCGCATPGGTASGLGALFLASLLGASRFVRRRRRDKDASRQVSG
jgi:MYXO-CTERM domain-containing protein